MNQMLQQAAQRLADGRVVAFPTETVYGLGADAENAAALAQIYAFKGRPANHPVIVHLPVGGDPAYWARNVPDEARTLMRAFWPGPLTLILQRADHISAAVSGGQDSIGLRCPSHPVAQDLLRRFAALKSHGQGGVAAPSANKFGRLSPTQAAHVRAEFTDLDEAELMVLDGGAAPVGIESTIVDLSRLDQGAGLVLLRPGHISATQLEVCLGCGLGQPDPAAPRVSGSLKAHYAPWTALAVLPLNRLVAQVRRDKAAGAGRIAAVVFDPAPLPAMSNVDWHRAASGPDAYASNLYALLRDFDQGDYARILLEQPPRSAAWQAVNDRIDRAAAAFTG